MKRLTFLSVAFLAIITLGTMTFYTSCKKDACKDVVCLHNGTCLDGTCSGCDAGYEGSDCGTLTNAKFVGIWVVTGNCTGTNGAASGADNYTATIAASSSDLSKVLIGNMWDAFSGTTTATVSGSTITIASQQPDNDGYSVSGSGTISGTTISFDYTVINTNTSPNPTQHCVGSWVRQ